MEETDIPDPDYITGKYRNKKEELLPTISEEYLEQDIKKARKRFGHLIKNPPEDKKT